MKIRNQILLSLILVALVPVIISSAFSVKIAEHEILKLRINSLNNINQSIYENINNYLKRIDVILQRLKNDENIFQNYSALQMGILDKSNEQYRKAKNNLDKLLQPIQRSNNYNDIFILNKDGTIIYSSNSGYSWKYSGLTINKLINIHLPINSNRVYYSPVFIDRLKGYEPSFLALTPVIVKNSNDNFYLAVEGSMGYIYKILSLSYDLGKTGESILTANTDNSQIIISPTRSSRNTVLQQKMQNIKFPSANETFTTIDYRNKKMIGVYLHIPDVNWNLITKIDQEEVYADISKLQYIAFLTAFIICVAALLIAIYLAKTISNPLLELKAAVQRIRDKHFEVDIDIKKKNMPEELEVLANAFSSMATQLKQYVSDLKEARNQAIKALEDLKTAESKLIESEKMSSIGVLTAGIAHEINNPINFISSSVTPLKKDIDDVLTVLNKYSAISFEGNMDEKIREVEEIKKRLDLAYSCNEINELLTSIHNGVVRVSEIVKALRVFSRLDEAEMKKANIKECIDSTLVLLVHEYKKQVTIHKDYADIPEFECRPGKVNQVLMNVLINAIQAIKSQGENKQGEIWISTREKDGQIEIRIKDNGPGISKAAINKIFEPFFTTKEVGTSTGLGLSISYGIMQQHHGNIEVKSEEGQGAEFIITFPKTQSVPKTPLIKS